MNTPTASAASCRTPATATAPRPTTTHDRVGANHAYATFPALQRLGVESTLLVFPDEGQRVLEPKNSKLFHDVVLSWIEGHLARRSAENP